MSGFFYLGILIQIYTLQSQPEEKVLPFHGALTDTGFRQN